MVGRIAARELDVWPNCMGQVRGGPKRFLQQVIQEFDVAPAASANVDGAIAIVIGVQSLHRRALDPPVAVVRYSPPPTPFLFPNASLAE